MGTKTEPVRTVKKGAAQQAKESGKPAKNIAKGSAGGVLRFHSKGTSVVSETHEVTVKAIQRTISQQGRHSGERLGADATAAIGQPAEQASVGSANAEQQENILAGKLVTAVAKNNPDVDALCSTYKLRREELGRLTGFSLRALAEWSGGKLPSQPARRRLHEVRRLLDALAEIIELEGIHHWLHQSNTAFDKLTPLQVIEVGEIDRLWAMVHDLNSGQPS